MGAWTAGLRVALPAHGALDAAAILAAGDRMPCLRRWSRPAE